MLAMPLFHVANYKQKLNYELMVLRFLFQSCGGQGERKLEEEGEGKEEEGKGKRGKDKEEKGKRG